MTATLVRPSPSLSITSRVEVVRVDVEIKATSDRNVKPPPLKPLLVSLSFSLMSSQHIASQLTRLALPLVSKHGFTTETLVIASTSLPSSSSSSSSNSPLSARTIDALYPSPPANLPSANSFSLKGLAIGNGGKRSLSRQELVALARGQGTVAGSEQSTREKTGPAKALFEAWLEEGRREMVKTVRESGLRGQDAMKRGLRARLEYNEQVLDMLPQVCFLLHSTSLKFVPT